MKCDSKAGSLESGLRAHGYWLKRRSRSDEPSYYVSYWFNSQGARYLFDGDLCAADGWLQYDTDQDAWYFGVWVHLVDRMVVSYAEGDCTVEVYDTEEEFRVQLAAMSRFYGAPPPVCVCVGPEGVTRVYDDDASRALDRPTQVRP